VAGGMRYERDMPAATAARVRRAALADATRR